MNKNDCYYLGKVAKTFGYKGDLSLYLDVDNPHEYENLDSAFFEIKGNLVPFFFKILQIKGNLANVEMQDVKPEKSNELVGAYLYLPLELLPKLDGNKFYFHEIIGFQVFDEIHGNIGYVESVIDNGPQPIFQIRYPENNKEILIPVLDQFIVAVDRKSKHLKLNAPEGLIDFYLAL